MISLATSSSAISRRDPLGVYMRDVQRYPLLSKDEEHDLAVQYFEQGDLDDMGMTPYERADVRISVG